MNTNPDYEPKRWLWPTYEPWMRDLLAADVRVSWESVQRETRELWAALTQWADWELDLVDLRIHPEDCPDKPADPVDELVKVIYEEWRSTEEFGDCVTNIARAVIAHFEAKS